jgi:hypothetical protein
LARRRADGILAVVFGLVGQVTECFAVNLADHITNVGSRQRGLGARNGGWRSRTGLALQHHQHGNDGDDEAYCETDEYFHLLLLLN